MNVDAQGTKQLHQNQNDSKLVQENHKHIYQDNMELIIPHVTITITDIYITVSHYSPFAMADCQDSIE